MTVFASQLPGRPRVSIITATYNASKTLRECIASVAEQSYENLEHIFIDGVSTDETVCILRQSVEKGKWISEPDKGIYDAWNKGLSLAKGEWICFLGADDKLLPGAVEAYVQLAQANAAADYLSSRVRWIGPKGKPRFIGKPWSWPRFQRYMCTAHPGSMHRRSLFERYGRYDINLRIVGDYEFLLRPAAQLKTAFMPMVTVEMQGGGTSDNIKALDETRQVKVNTAKRNPTMAGLERLVARQTFRLRRTFSR